MTRNLIALCTDRRMLVPASFVAHSVRKHAAQARHPFDLLIVAQAGEVDEPTRCWLEQNQIALYEKLDFARLRDVAIIQERLSIATLAKLVLPEEMAGRYGKILYLDSDLTVHEDLSVLFSLDTGEWPLAAELRGRIGLDQSRDQKEKEEMHFEQLGLTRPYRFFNTGVLLIDVAKWNRENLTSRTLDYIRQHSRICHLPDEHGLNGVLKGRIAQLSPVWNMRAPNPITKPLYRYVKPAIIHYSGPDKPWCRYGRGKRLFPDLTAYRLYDEFLRDSPWPDWLRQQWNDGDFWQSVRWEIRERWREGRNQLRGATRAGRKKSYQTFARHCAQDPYADVEQGIVVREAGRLRVRPEPVLSSPTP